MITFEEASKIWNDSQGYITEDGDRILSQFFSQTCDTCDHNKPHKVCTDGCYTNYKPRDKNEI